MTYELVSIVSPKLTDQEAEAKAHEIAALVGKMGGTVTREEFWGKRQLAMPIGQFEHGYYGFLEFDADTARMKDMDAKLRLDESVVRFLIVRVDEYTKKKLAEQKVRMSADVEKEAAREREKKAVARQVQMKETAKEMTKSKSTTDLAALDKKIDEILDKDIV